MKVMKTYKERRRYRAPKGFYNLERQELSERSGGYDHYYHMDRHTSGSSFVDGEATEFSTTEVFMTNIALITILNPK